MLEKIRRLESWLPCLWIAFAVICFSVSNLIKADQSALDIAGDAAVEHAQNEWTYSNQKSWTCESKNLRQSPIDIITDDVIVMEDWKLNFINYNQKAEFQMKNTHHSLSLMPICKSKTPSVQANWIPGINEFELKDIHFHWGDGINKGSEHEVNDKRAAAEMHMVHYKKGLDKDQIGNVENSIVVIGVFIESDNLEHNKLEGLVKSASKVNGTDAESLSDNPEKLINLLPDSLDSFYTYNGSLTTPPCFEVVTWVIMSQPIYMNQERLVELSRMARANSAGGMQEIGPNFRDIQPLLGRPVYSSHNTSISLNLHGIREKISIGRLLERYRSGIERFARIKNAANKIARSMKLKLIKQQKLKQSQEDATF